MKTLPKGKVLVTGGGAWNKFLTEKIFERSGYPLYIPDEKLINFKEALIFAFLGLLRYNNEVNCLSSVTGSKTDISTGIIHLAP
ncbi:MAG: hypothetical protein HC906_10535 [Bacteroidales bacterium]|nr:hypothetical protein [Bacteroidales bacterium]